MHFQPERQKGMFCHWPKSFYLKNKEGVRLFYYWWAQFKCLLSNLSTIRHFKPLEAASI
jgi:hypothetical protein